MTGPEGELRLVIAGIAGRMGAEVARVSAETHDIRLLGGLERAGHPLIGGTISTGAGGALVPVREDLTMIPGVVSPQAEGREVGRTVLIEFSLGAGAVRHAAQAAELGLAVVSGSTALTDEEEGKLRELAQRTPLFRAPNFSRGAALLLREGPHLVSELGAEFDTEIIESHHHHKRDLPSGTARVLAESVARVTGGAIRTGRRMEDGLRREREIGVHGVRAGGLVGEHRLLMAGQGETLEVVHRVHSREAFARGAIQAARLVSRAQSGYYEMKDLLGTAAHKPGESTNDK